MTLASAPHVSVTGRAPDRQLRRSGLFQEMLSDTPWRVGDVVRMSTRLGIGLVGVVATWVGASGTLVFADQVAWTAGGVLATVFAAIGGVAWVLSGVGAVGRERRWVREQIRANYLPMETSAAEGLDGRRVTVDGMTRFHRPDCDVVRDKPAHVVLDVTTLKPCAMCKP